MKAFIAIAVCFSLVACGEQGNVGQSDAAKLPKVSSASKSEQAEAAMADMVARQKKLADAAGKYGAEEEKR